MTYTQRGRSYCTIQCRGTHTHAQPTLAPFEYLLDYFQQRLLVISCGCCYCCGYVKCQRQGSSALLAALAPANDMAEEKQEEQGTSSCTMPFVSAHLKYIPKKIAKKKRHSICMRTKIVQRKFSSSTRRNKPVRPTASGAFAPHFWLGFINLHIQ